MTLTPIDGSSLYWIPETGADTAIMNRMNYFPNEDKIVAFDNTGKIAESADSISWDVSSNAGYEVIAYSPTQNRYVALKNSVLYYSPVGNRNSFTAISGDRGILNNIVYVPSLDRFIATGRS